MSFTRNRLFGATKLVLIGCSEDNIVNVVVGQDVTGFWVFRVVLINRDSEPRDMSVHVKYRYAAKEN